MGEGIAAFRAEAADWLATQLAGPFSALRGQTSLVACVEERRAWERALACAGWAAIGWPVAQGGRGAGMAEQVAFAEEYARAEAPPRLGHLGIELLGPTLLALGTPDQQARFLPRILDGRDIWCQGYSEPNAGSDLANVQTRARWDGTCWRLDGQKIWTSLGTIADWCFVLARAEPGSRGQAGLAFLLVDMRQPGVTPRPIRQMTGEAEFAEVFFDGAVARAEDMVGAPGEGWRVAMALLGFERGVSTLAQQMHFQNELTAVISAAKRTGAARDAGIRQRIAAAHAGLRIMRASALRMLDGGDSATLSGPAYTYKIYWARWRQALGELAMDVLGGAGARGVEDATHGELVRLYLASRADTIYAGTDQIQRNIIAERALGLPREKRG